MTMTRRSLTAKQRATDASEAKLNERVNLERGYTWIYIFHRHPHCKIGFTRDLKRRAGTIRTAAAGDLVVSVAIPIPTPIIKRVEAIAHKTLHLSRCNGEWFSVTPGVAEESIANAISEVFLETAIRGIVSGGQARDAGNAPANWKDAIGRKIVTQVVIAERIARMRGEK